MTRKQLLDKNRAWLATPEVDCDPEISLAIVCCTAAFKDGDSLVEGIPSRTIKSKVQSFFDPQFALFAGRYLFPTSWIYFSELMEISLGESDELIQSWGRRTLIPVGIDSGRRDGFTKTTAATISSIRNFNRLCHLFYPSRIEAVSLKTDVDPEKRRSRKLKLDSALTIRTLFFHTPWCELCLELCEIESHRLTLRRGGRDVPADKCLVGGRLSDRFCYAHSSGAGERYKKDRERRGPFYSVMRLIIEARKSQGRRPLDPETLRANAYEIVFRDGRIPKKLQALHEFFLTLEKEQSTNLDDPSVNKQLLAFFEPIVAEAIGMGYKPVTATKMGIRNRNMLTSLSNL